MLGLVLLYFIGSGFSKLAKRQGEHKWGYIVLGIASYYVGALLGGLLLAVAFVYGLDKGIDPSMETGITVLSVPIGLLVCWGVYRWLESRDKKKNMKKHDNFDMLDEDII